MENQAEDPDRLPATAADFKAVLQAITALTGKVDQANVEFIRKDFDAFRGRMTELEQRISRPHDHVPCLLPDIHTLKARVKTLESRAEHAENHNRRNNLRILGLPEGVEGADPTAFAERLLQQLLPLSTFFSILYCGKGSSHIRHQGAPGSTTSNLYL